MRTTWLLIRCFRTTTSKYARPIISRETYCFEVVFLECQVPNFSPIHILEHLIIEEEHVLQSLSSSQTTSRDAKPTQHIEITQ